MSIWDDDPKPKRKPRWVGLTIGFVVFLGLVAGAIAAGEYLARDLAKGVVAAPVSSLLGAEEGADVDVDFGDGILVFQLVTGSIDTVHATADPVVVAGASAHVAITASDVPLSTTATIGRLSAVLTIGGSGLGDLARTLVGAEAGDVVVGDGGFTVATTTLVGGSAVPAIVTLEPSVAEGRLVFTVLSVDLGGTVVDVATLVAGAYGAEAAALAAPTSLCVADDMPAGLELQSVTAGNGHIVVTLAGSGVKLGGGKGTCEVPIAETETTEGAPID